MSQASETTDAPDRNASTAQAVHDLGYRGWSGNLNGGTSRWLVIAATGIQRAWQSRWLRRMISAAWLPAFLFAIGFFLWEKSLVNREQVEPLLDLMRHTAPRDLHRAAVEGLRSSDLTTARHGVWSWLLLSFFRKPQGVLMVVVVGLIAPRLISQDIRSRAFLLYFSRPIGRGEYVLGKTCTILFYLALISTLPALVLYLLGVLLSPSVSVVWATWDLPLRILAASAVLTIPTAGLSLCLSSLTQESRIAGFAWFATWVLGWVTYGIMTAVDAANTHGQMVDFSRWSNFSLYHMLGNVQSWIFGFAEFKDVWFSLFMLIALTIVSFSVLFRQVTAPMRA